MDLLIFFQFDQGNSEGKNCGNKNLKIQNIMYCSSRKIDQR